ncbi:hypothetical protein ACFQX7_23035 [Luedemannella flava]
MIWAIALAVHQPLMQPDPVMVDPTTHETYVGVASNNTYWPRDIRQFAILLALVGVIVICRAKPRGSPSARRPRCSGSAPTCGWTASTWPARRPRPGWPSPLLPASRRSRRPPRGCPKTNRQAPAGAR